MHQPGKPGNTSVHASTLAWMFVRLLLVYPFAVSLAVFYFFRLAALTAINHTTPYGDISHTADRNALWLAAVAYPTTVILLVIQKRRKARRTAEQRAAEAAHLRAPRRQPRR